MPDDHNHTLVYRLTQRLIVSARLAVAYINKISPTVRHSISHVRIISPPWLQADMAQEMRIYLENSFA